MNVEDQNDKISDLKSQWDEKQPLTEEKKLKLWDKLRLEWNFNSNHIEGNTLSYGETELLLIHDIATGSHILREYEEMKAHDVAINHIYKLSQESRFIGETDIRDLNRIILKERYWKEAETADGQKSHKEIIPGQYKILPNNVRTASGQIFHFASPIDVPQKMADFVKWLELSQKDVSLSLTEIAAKLHHDFVLIHPFDDGNGRTARLLVNYFLLKKGFLPIAIKTSRKKDYLLALQQADAGDISKLEDHISSEIIWSLNLGLKAAAGEDLEELSDIEKEIALFAKEIIANPKAPQVKKRNVETIVHLYNIGIRKFIVKFSEKIQSIQALFDETKVQVIPGQGVIKGDGLFGYLDRLFDPTHLHNIQQINIAYDLRGFKGSAANPFGVKSTMHLIFNEYNYQITFDNSSVITKLYSEPIASDEGDVLIQGELKRLFQNIKTNSRR